MKFFVQLVSCCGCSSKRADRAAEEEETLVPAAAVESSDLNDIITYKRRRRRRRGSARSAGSFPEWKPSLSSISEDADHAPAANSGRNWKKKKAVIAASRPIKQLRHRLKSR